jgi:acyl-CoA synthetase (AMP-forming)/AMP-acid ligase II
MMSYHPSPAEPATLVDLLRQHAQKQPGQYAFTFLEDGEAAETRMSYGELDQHARAIAAALQQLAPAGARALLLYPPGLEFIAAFFGCLYAGVVAVPAYPPDPARLDRTLPRLRALAEDAGPLVALTTAPILGLIEALGSQSAGFPALRWLATDTLADASAADWQATSIADDALAFLQYTSGSTAAPKGVMVSHANLLHNQRLIRAGFAHDAQTVVVGWLPLYHDMGLIGNVLQPLYLGVPCVLMSPFAFLQRPLRWLQAMTRYQATTSGGPNFAYDLCVRKIAVEQRAALDLRSWRVAYNGAEPVRSESLQRFVAAFAPCGFRAEAFYPCYGLAEATLFVTGGQASAPPVVLSVHAPALARDNVVAAADDGPDARALVGAGHAWLDQQVLIVDPASGMHCPPDRVGEIWVAGPSVAGGYWQRPDETAQTFHATLAGSGAGPFLRTGDLGFMRDDALFVAGRLKDLIIIRGRNLYPQDIELTVERSHPALRPGCGAAFAIELDGEERLVVVQEVERQARDVNIAQVAGAIRRAVVGQHAVQVYVVVLLPSGSIPKTSSGKIQRHACRAAFLDGTIAPLGSDRLADPDAVAGDAPPNREPLLGLAPAATDGAHADEKTAEL